jgi:hypothetical protein
VRRWKLLSGSCGGYSLATIREIGGSVPQQRLVITLENGRRIVSEPVTLSDSDDRKLMKTIDDAKPHRRKIDTVDIEKVEEP